jgi:Homeodomain
MKYTSLRDENTKYDFSPLKDFSSRMTRRKTIRKRKRKSLTQLEILSKEFEKDPDWNKQHITRIMKNTGLTEAQIYKWGWDQKKKVNHLDKPKKQQYPNLSEIFSLLNDIKLNYSEKIIVNKSVLSCSEVILPDSMDYYFVHLQRVYKSKIDELRQENTHKKNLGCIFESFINND